MVQETAFEEDLYSLKYRGSISRNSKLLNLSPFIDAQGIIRVGGRLQKAAISPDTKHPTLLPANHLITRLIIICEHQIEAVMNSRPITSLSNLNDLSFLTTGHFLVEDVLTSIPQQDVIHLPINRLSKWQRVNQTHQHFWKRWNCEYLQQLQQQTK